jgi:hypothetical protein
MKMGMNLLSVVCTPQVHKNFYVLLPYIIYYIYVMQSRRFSQCPAFLLLTAKERDKKYSVKSP